MYYFYVGIYMDCIRIFTQIWCRLKGTKVIGKNKYFYIKLLEPRIITTAQIAPSPYQLVIKYPLSFVYIL